MPDFHIGTACSMNIYLLSIGQQYQAYFFICLNLSSAVKKACMPVTKIEHGNIRADGSTMFSPTTVSSKKPFDFIGSRKKAQSLPMHGSNLLNGHFFDIVFLFPFITVHFLPYYAISNRISFIHP